MKDEIETLRQRVKELEKELGECQVHFFGYDKLSDELTAERAISDKLEKALWEYRGHFSSITDGRIALTELAAMRKVETE